MAHAFDTHNPRAQRTTVRSRAVEILSPLTRAQGGYLQAVIPWGGVIRSYQDVEGIAMLYEAFAGRAPSIAIALGDKSLGPAGMGGFQWTSTVDLLVFHFANHARSLLEGRVSIDVIGLADDTADPGLEVAMEHAEELLIGQFPRSPALAGAVTIKGIRPTREEEIYTEAAQTIWMQTYQVTLTRTIDEFRGATELLDEMRTRLKLEPTETNLPDPAVDPSTVDVNTDGLAP